MATSIPFRFITGLDPVAQKEIERDFLHVQGQIAGNSTIYDAIIDPAQTTSNTSTHLYKNLTDLLTGESLSSTRTFTVGVIPRNNATITETGALTLQGPLAIAALGLTGSSVGNIFAPGSRVKWDLAGQTINTTFQTYFQGLDIRNSGTQISGIVTGSNAPATFNSCIVNGSDVNTGGSGSNRQITAPSATSGVAVYADNTLFESVQFRGPLVATDCYYALNNALASSVTLNPNNGSFIWDGGLFFINHASSATTITIGGSSTDQIFLRASDTSQTLIDGSSGGSGSHRITIAGAGTNYVDLEGTGYNLTVNSSAGPTVVRGNYLNLVITNGTNNFRQVSATVSAGLDVTGPCLLDAYVTGTVTVNLAGIGISGKLVLRKMGSAPWLTVANMDDSIVQVSFAAPDIGSQAYTIDAASDRSYLLTSGTTAANFSVASTNASATTRVGSETAGT